ncbi:hypothetical protein KUV65_01240 [Maritalea mobilis]|uniref:hypothetical protein n=1 Tax=Maritalea mobilis TaxID=483324 RepID=UPI001C94105B|nr:hypothetical protein [Maritalea mobilis]MBY6199974.1 hypothetical protein [Maritalea mobilis]
MPNKVETLLTDLPAAERIGPMPRLNPGARPWRWSYGAGAPGRSAFRLNAATAPLVFGVFMAVLLVAILVANLSNGVLDGGQLRAAGLIVIVLLVLVGPHTRRKMNGTLQWRREVEITKRKVRVTDRSGKAVETWKEPLSAYRDIHHRIGHVTGFDPSGVGSSKAVPLDVIELRHPDPGRTIYLHGSAQTSTGGMSPMDMIRAGRKGRREEVEAAVGSTRNPRVEALLRQLERELGMPVTRET